MRTGSRVWRVSVPGGHSAASANDMRAHGELHGPAVRRLGFDPSPPAQVLMPQRWEERRLWYSGMRESSGRAALYHKNTLTNTPPGMVHAGRSQSVAETTLPRRARQRRPARGHARDL